RNAPAGQPPAAPEGSSSTPAPGPSSGLAPGAAPTASLMPAYIFFDPNSAALSAEARALVANLAAHLKQNPEARVHITGYVDKTGTRAKNLELAQARAKAIHLALREHGVGEHQLNLKAPADIIGGPDNQRARRVDVHPALPAPAAAAPH
ncbi:MAG TPA: OmpA family protein, partial [Burkholderiales bacterium]|nr:OmpA family protein [Burkholderiales bacterium]